MSELTLWTDWSRTDVHYFWRRGALWGVVFTLLILLPVARRLRPWIVVQGRRWWRR